MNIMLETTIQIDRFLASNDKKNIIRDILDNDENKIYSSTYVLGEYMSNIVYDTIAMYSIILAENDLNQAFLKINENVFGQRQNRVAKIFTDMRILNEDNIEEIKETYAMYIQQLVDRFYYGLDDDLINETDCSRAKAKIVYEDGMPVLDGITCTKKDDKCEICKFWKNNACLLKDKRIDEVEEKIKPLICKINSGEYNIKGNNCKSMGDTIIAIESAKKEKCKIFTTNKKHFAPICELVGVELITI